MHFPWHPFLAPVPNYVPEKKAPKKSTSSKQKDDVFLKKPLFRPFMKTVSKIVVTKLRQGKPFYSAIIQNMQTMMKNRLANQRGNQIIMGTLALTALGIVVVGVGKGFFSMTKFKTTTEAKISFVDYESAFLEALGSKVNSALINCAPSTLNNLDFPIGNLGSAKFLGGSFRGGLGITLGVNNTTNSGANQTELNQAFATCPDSVNSVPNTSAGTYSFCLGLQSVTGTGFNGLMGAFAKIRIDLGTRNGNSNQRILAGAISCNQFRADAQREIKINYKIYFKKFDEDLGIFTRSGTYVF